MQEVKEQKAKLNKGFSLVELIVVIAIMAVLVGIIATQFVKYVGQSKDTADKTNVETLQSSANAVLADTGLGTIGDGTFVINGNGTFKSKSANITDQFKTLLEAALGTDAKGKVKYPKASDTSQEFTITVTDSGDGGFSASVKLGAPEAVEDPAPENP